MVDVWYYAEGEAAKGPMPFAELVKTLSSMPNPAGVMVWHVGFEKWQKVLDVREVAERVFVPPPLVTTPPPVPSSPQVPPIKVTAPMVTPQVTRERESPLKPSVLPPPSDTDLKGIGGWLFLVAIGQILGLLKFMVTMFEYYTTLDSSLINRFPASFIGEGLMNAGLGLLYVTTAVLFFRLSRLFPRFFVYEVMAAIFSGPIAALWVATTMSMVTGQSVSSLMQHAFDHKEVVQTIFAAIGGSIWILYIFKSKRVANTFVH